MQKSSIKTEAEAATENAVKINNIDANGRIDQLSLQYLDFLLKYYPSIGTMLGIYSQDGKLDSLDPDKIDEVTAQVKSIEQELRDVDPKELSPEDYTDYLLLKSELHKHLREYEEEKRYIFEPSLYPGTCFNSIYGLLFRHGNRLPEKAGAILSRMGQIPEYLESAKKLLKKPPQLYLESAIETTNSGKLLFEGSLTELFNGELSQHWSEFEELKTKVLQALDDYVQFLEKDLSSQCIDSFAIGRDAFEDRLKNDNFLTENADEIEALGREYYRQTEEELIKLAETIDPGTSWVELIKRQKKHHPTPENMIEEYEKITYQARDYVVQNKLVSFPPGEKMEIIFTPPFQQHLIPWAAFFPPAYFDRESIGHSLVTPPNPQFPPEKQEMQMQEHNYIKMILNSIHEAYPGHHLQLSWARENPRIIRALSPCHLFVEGWALYTEELMKELGYIKEPIQILFQLKDKLWRAARIIIDVGLHVKGMSVEKAVEVLTESIGYSPYAALTEVKRYAHSPTQPMTYLTGLSKIMQMRDQFKKKYPLQPLREFHDRMMKAGSIPPSLMAVEMGLLE